MAEDKKEIEMKEQIRSYLTRRDYYQLLGIVKQAPDTDIKKAYKKLALRFHPDKNKTQGSKQVFNKISNAYANLIDPQKRAGYDRFGPEQDRAPQFQQRRQNAYNPQDQFQNIFQTFFGQNFRFQNNRHQQQTYTFQMGGNRRRNANANPQQQQEGKNFSFLFFIMIVLVLYVGPVIFSPKVYHSSQRSSTYHTLMKTPNFQAPYYVSSDFFTQARDKKDFKKEIEETVQYQFLFKLKKQCDEAIYARNKYMHYARQYSPGAYKAQLEAKAHNVDQSSCQHQKVLYEKHAEHIRDLHSKK